MGSSVLTGLDDWILVVFGFWTGRCTGGLDLADFFHHFPTFYKANYELIIKVIISCTICSAMRGVGRLTLASRTTLADGWGESTATGGGNVRMVASRGDRTISFCR